MLGNLTMNVSLSAAVLLIALWLIARHEADLDWSKLMIVSALTGMLSVVAPMFIWASIVEHFHWNLLVMWPVVLITTLAWQIGIFVVMLNRFVWVPIPKALLAWVIVQVLLVTKDSVFALIKGESLVGSAWTTVTGMDTPSRQREAARRAEESGRQMELLKRASEEGNVEGMISALDPDAAVPSAATNAVASAPATTSKAIAVTAVMTETSTPAAVGVSSATDAEREASRKLLVISGMTKRQGQVILLMNGRAVEVGDTVTVSLNGHRYTWRLAGVENKQPRWE